MTLNLRSKSFCTCSALMIDASHLHTSSAQVFQGDSLNKLYA